MKRALLATAILLLTLAVPPAAAGAAGGFAGAGDIYTGDIGIADAETGTRYFALSERQGTRLLRIRGEAPAGARALEELRLDEQLTIPAAAFDGTTTGLSADGRWLVLADPYVVPGQASSRMVLVDTGRMAVEKEVRLDGAFVFDAISPDASRLYFVHYPNANDPLEYEVRAWDVGEERLLTKPIIDKRTAPEVMRGTPITRATSPDGAWAYTLYRPGGKHHPPFVHALNTSTGEALCIDLPMLHEEEVAGYKLVPAADGAAISVRNRADAEVATISTEDWLAAAPGEGPAAAESSSTPPLLGAGLLAVGVGALGLGWWRRRRAQAIQGAPHTQEGPNP